MAEWHTNRPLHQYSTLLYSGTSLKRKERFNDQYVLIKRADRFLDCRV